MNTVYKWVATRVCDGLGSGQMRPAPGTWGSAAATLLLVLLAPTNPQLATALLISFPVSYWALGAIKSDLSELDAGWIVIDEWQGIAITWLIAQPTNWLQYCVVFALFRLFDITKLAPAWQIDQNLTFPYGVLVDDWVAGLYAGCVAAGLFGILKLV